MISRLYNIVKIFFPLIPKEFDKNGAVFVLPKRDIFMGNNTLKYTFIVSLPPVFETLRKVITYWTDGTLDILYPNGLSIPQDKFCTNIAIRQDGNGKPSIPTTHPAAIIILCTPSPLLEYPKSQRLRSKSSSDIHLIYPPTRLFWNNPVVLSKSLILQFLIIKIQLSLQRTTRILTLNSFQLLVLVVPLILFLFGQQV